MNTRIATLILLTGMFHGAFGQTNSSTPVPGDWSPPVADNGATLRARLSVAEGYWQTNSDALPGMPRRWVHEPVYLELEHVLTSGWAPPRAIYFDVVSGLKFEVHDSSGKSIPSQQVVLGAKLPNPYWVTLPCGATVKLRADLSHIGLRTNLTNPVRILVGNANAFHVVEWEIPETSTAEYFLSCTFNAATNSATFFGIHPSAPDYPVWQGTLKVPQVRIPVRKP
jgi:hypothetical protein